MGKRRRQRIDQTEYTATIETLSHDGRGIARIDGKATFLFNGLPGETVQFRYTKKRGQYDEGTVTAVLTPAPDRQTPACAHFGVCGGCSLQHIDNAKQLSLKTAAVMELLTQQGVSPQHTLPPLKSPSWGYRRKARLGAKYILKKDTPVVGFRERGASLIANINHCKILDPRVGEKIETLKDWLASLDARTTIPQIEMAATEETVALIIRHLAPLSETDLEKIRALGHAEQFHIYLQPAGIDSITRFYPDTESTLLQYRLPAYALTLQFHPSQFTQINETINQAMIQQALQLMDIQADDQVLDLFCGIGNFSLPIAQTAKTVTGVEGDATAVQRAIENAKLNKLNNTHFYTANLFEDCTHQPFMQRTYSKVLLDPPRSGAEAILASAGSWQAKSIIYVSCSPATFARDAAILEKQGYRLESLGMMDMFPHTKHIELMGRFIHDQYTVEHHRSNMAE